VYKVPVGTSVLVSDKELVIAGQSLTEGATDLKELYAVKGKEAVQRYILQEIQHIYSSQGQDLNDKHIEIILRQLFSRSEVTDPGDTGFIIGDVLEATEIRRVNKELPKGKKPAQYSELFLGMTKAALNTSSFLSAASFQQTLQVLIRAAITGHVDRLKGLKENVIIGRLIPAGTGFKLYDKIEEYLITK
jgi:DNA-directed RNA polymerase subunit beta'